MGCAYCCASSRDEAQKSLEVRTLAMQEQLERVAQRPELEAVVSDQIRAMFERLDLRGDGSISVQAVEALCVELGRSAPESLKDFDKYDEFSLKEFDAWMRVWFATKDDTAVEVLLLKSSAAVSWADECWHLGVRNSDVEEGEVVMFSETVIRLFVNEHVPGLSRSTVEMKVLNKFDRGGGAGSFTLAEFRQAYLYFLWIMFKHKNICVADSNSWMRHFDVEVCEFDAAEIEEKSYAMKEHLEAVSPRILKMINATIDTLFKKLDPAENGSIRVEDAKTQFVRWGRIPPHNLRSFDSDRNNRLDKYEFEAMMKSYFTGKGRIVTQILLKNNKTAKSWCEDCWELGVRATDKEDGEPAMHLQIVLALFARVAEIIGTTKMTEEEAMDEFCKWDVGRPGQLRFKEFLPLYIYLLWVIHEGSFLVNNDIVPSSAASDGAKAEQPAVISTLAMKRQLERVRSELYGVIREQIMALFKKTDKAGNGSLPVEDVKALFTEMDQAIPDDMKAYDFNHNRTFEIVEFDALLKGFLMGKGHVAAEYLLMYSSVALAWSEESWNLGVRSTDVHNGEVCMRVETVVELFARVAEINATPGMSEEEIKAEILRLDIDASGSVTRNEYTQLYMYFLWLMYEDLKHVAVDQASSSSEESDAPEEIDDVDRTSLIREPLEGSKIGHVLSSANPQSDADNHPEITTPPTNVEVAGDDAGGRSSKHDPECVTSDVPEAQKRIEVSEPAANEHQQRSAAADLRSTNDSECAESGKAQAQELAPVDTFAMKQQLERVRSELYEVVHEQFRALFQKKVRSGYDYIPIEDIRALFTEMDHPLPDDLKVFDFNRNRRFEEPEFDALMKSFFARKGHVAVEYLLMYSSVALKWSEESWTLGVRSTDVCNGEVFMRVETVVELFARVAEINETPGMSEEEVRAEILKFDRDASGSISFDEYARVYLYFLWLMYEDLKADAQNNASSSGEESEASGDKEREP